VYQVDFDSFRDLKVREMSIHDDLLKEGPHSNVDYERVNLIQNDFDSKYFELKSSFIILTEIEALFRNSNSPNNDIPSCQTFCSNLYNLTRHNIKPIITPFQIRIIPFKIQNDTFYRFLRLQDDFLLLH
jgi:hypothetical protein